MVALGYATSGSLALYLTGIETLMDIYPDRWPALLATDLRFRTEVWKELGE